jgi:hypothetical protein
MIRVLASSAINPGFEPWLVQTKDYTISNCCFSGKHAASRRKRKDWLAWDQNNGPFSVQAGIKFNFSEFIFIFDLLLRFYCSGQKSRQNMEIKSY